ncbi:citrate synthase [Ceratobasidium sp. 392]|nr:citrate synthase [Ceratobasidium sp. 392]
MSILQFHPAIPVAALFPHHADVKSQLLASVPAKKQDILYNFLLRLELVKLTTTSTSIKAITLIAEGVPKHHVHEILHVALEKGVLINGPVTVGGIKLGHFHTINSGGLMSNIIASKPYHAGSVGYVSKSGGMSNKLNNILSLVTDKTYMLPLENRGLF